jgi:Major capsid protein Gp23
MDVSKIGGSPDLVQKWSKALDGIKSEYTARVTAQLLENQAKAVLAESQRAINEAGEGLGTTTVGNLGTFQKFAFPLVRRVYPNLVFNYIGATQPMDAPVSQIFYLGNSRWAGGTAADQQVVYSKFNLTYNAWGQNETSAIDTRIEGGTQLSQGSITGTLAGGTGGGSFMLSSVLSGTRGSPSTTYGGKIASFPDQTTTLGWVVSAGERLDGTGIPEVQFHIEQQAVVARTRKMRALWTIEASQDLKAYHNLDLERELTELLSKELSLEIDRELIEDVRMIAYGLGAATRGTSMGGWVAGSLDGNYNPNNFGTEYGKLSTGTGTLPFSPSGFNWGNGAGQFQTNNAARNNNVIVVDLKAMSTLASPFAPQHLGHIFSNLLAVLNYASQDIYKSTQRGPGTVLITSPLMASLLESAAKLEGGVPANDAPTNMGGKIEYKGKFAGKYDLIVDPLFPEDEIVMGYNGGSPMDAGFVYCPYIPLMPLPTVTDPSTFQPRKGIMTRYAKAAIQPASRFYRVIRVVGTGSDFLRPQIYQSNGIGLANI